MKSVAPTFGASSARLRLRERIEVQVFDILTPARTRRGRRELRLDALLSRLSGLQATGSRATARVASSAIV